MHLAEQWLREVGQSQGVAGAGVGAGAGAAWQVASEAGSVASEGVQARGALPPTGAQHWRHRLSPQALQATAAAARSGGAAGGLSLGPLLQALQLRWGLCPASGRGVLQLQLLCAAMDAPLLPLTCCAIRPPTPDSPMCHGAASPTSPRRQGHR
jgi:hypothetical protein